jgi:hypothetical protein
LGKLHMAKVRRSPRLKAKRRAVLRVPRAPRCSSPLFVLSPRLSPGYPPASVIYGRAMRVASYHILLYIIQFNSLI